jgi:lipoate-protein ligase A
MISKLSECRLLLDAEPRSGDWNMAVDAALLETAIRDSIATFRWYRWSEPTLSLGYFQNEEELAHDSRWSTLPKVRRLTGGGAILHHHEWTYSFAVPAQQPLFRHPEELYDLVHQAIIDLLNRLGGSAGLRGETARQPPEPWLCFSRRDAHDVVWRGHKILGSAQRRRKGAVLQHGSLLERASSLTPEHLGVMDLDLPMPLTLEDLTCVPNCFAEMVRIESDEVGE